MLTIISAIINIIIVAFFLKKILQYLKSYNNRKNINNNEINKSFIEMEFF